IDEIANLERPGGYDSLRPRYLGSSRAKQKHGNRLATLFHYFLQHFCDKVTFRNTRPDFSHKRFDRLSNDFGRAFYERNLFCAFNRARFLHETRGILKTDLRERRTKLLVDSPRDNAFGSPHQSLDSDYADSLGTDFLQTLDDRFGIGAARRADILHPFLRKAPPLDLVFTSHDDGNI